MARISGFAVLAVLATAMSFAHAQLVLNTVFTREDLLLEFAEFPTPPPTGNSRIDVIRSLVGSLTIVKNILEPCGTREVHYHPRGDEPNFVEKGNFIIGVLLEDNKLVSAKRGPGEAFYAPRGYPHFIYNPTCEEGLYYGVLNSGTSGTVNIPTALAPLQPEVVLRDWKDKLPEPFPGILAVVQECRKRCTTAG